MLRVQKQNVGENHNNNERHCRERRGMLTTHEEHCVRAANSTCDPLHLGKILCTHYCVYNETEKRCIAPVTQFSSISDNECAGGTTDLALFVKRLNVMYSECKN